jgi:hypothetical protein
MEVQDHSPSVSAMEYQKALELDPKNPNAEGMLKKLQAK